MVRVHERASLEKVPICWYTGIGPQAPKCVSATSRSSTSL